MPLHRDPGRVFCGHCTRRVAELTCPGCHREVCAPCAADFESCPRPRSFRYRLGFGARLRLISMKAQLGVVSTLTQRLELIELTRHRRLESASWSYRWTRAMKRFGAVTAAGELLQPRSYRLMADGSLRATSVALVDAVIDLEQPITGARFDRSETALIATTSDERVMVIELARPEERERRPVQAIQIVAPLNRRVLQAIDADAAAGLVCGATHNELGVVRIEDGEARSVGVVPTANLDTAWVGVAGSRVAVILGDSGGFANPFVEHVLQIREIGSSLEPIYSATHRRGGALQHESVADISDDGRFVAVALASGEIAVHDVERGGVQRLGGHTDKIASLRFGPGGSFLASGDFDNRVIVRFRGGSGFAGPLEDAELVDGA